MKLKRCFKTVLSSLLAAAMIITAAPAGLSLSVQAAPTDETASDAVQVTDMLEAVVPANDATTPDLTSNGGDASASPVVDGNSVTFNYVGTEDTAAVTVAGSMNNWSPSANALIEGEDNVWSTTINDLAAGYYEYKFVVDSQWKPDPSNTLKASDTSSNSVFIINGLLDTELTAAQGTVVDLPTSLEAYDAVIDYASATSIPDKESKAVTYALVSNVEGVTLDGDSGSQKLTLPAGLAETTTAITLTASENGNTNNTCTVTVKVVKAIVTSPVVGNGTITFNYSDSEATSLYVNYGKVGSNGWKKKEMAKDNETGYWTVTVKAGPGTYAYGFMPNGSGWSVDPLNPNHVEPSNPNSNSVVTVTNQGEVVSPEISGKQVTFRYEDATHSKTKVVVTGEGEALTAWSADGIPMEYNDVSGYWELTLNLSAGLYAYKFVADGSWEFDLLNMPPAGTDNSEFVVIGLADYKTQVEKGSEAVVLPKTLSLYGEDGNATDANVTYTLSAETSKEEYSNKIVLGKDAEGNQTICVAEDFPADTVEAFTLTATDGNNNTSVVTINVVKKLYTYNIYYYDEEHRTEETPTINDAALWIYSQNVNGKEYAFTETVSMKADDDKEHTWLKATVQLDYTDVRIIPKSKSADPTKPDWTWQDAGRGYVNEVPDDETNLYIIYDDDKNIYTELPQTVKKEKRYLVVEYERTDSIDNWYLYTWNSGYGSDVWVPFEKVDDKNGIASVRIKNGLESLSFCLVNTPTKGDWNSATKDGGDWLISVPVDQYVVKVKMAEGQGVTKQYPYNIGYELDPENNTIHFYYRDDTAFAAGSEGGFDSVAIDIDGTENTMSWDAENQRYYYDYVESDNNLHESYNYRYKRTLATPPDDFEAYVLDKFNDTMTTVEKDSQQVDYSVVEYKKFDAEVVAEFYNPSMDYNDNNVLSISFKEGESNEQIVGIEVGSATANLTEVGFAPDTPIDPQLLELSIAVGEWIEAGTKTIPVTVFDQYNNKYTTETTVEVVNRNKGDDFDWDEAVIYFAVTDRFFDGNKSNNGKGYNTDEATGGSSYHGGDFKGLTQKLDYLQDLGVNTIWITPIVANDMAEGLTTSEGLASWGYHGYWASNFEKLDSHLGTEKEFKALLDAAHKRGMKIMVDVVLNHAGYNNEEYFNNILKDEEGNPVRMIREDDEMVNGDDKRSSLSGLPDFLTENPEVRDLLVEWQSNWVSKYDIDYYRVDTVKHVDDTTWSAFKNALTKIDPEFKMIGEWAGAGYSTDTGMLYSGRMDSLLDFDFNNEATKFVNGDIAEVESFLTARNSAIDNTASLGAFIGSHDEDGFAYKLVHPESGTGVSEEQAMALTKVAASLQITAKGQTVIYYGEEIGMTGANNYPYQDNRYDFDWSLVNDDNDMLAHYKKLLSIRDQYSEVFAKGVRTTIAADDDEGYDVFKKEYGGIDVYTALNINDSEKEVIIPGFRPNTYVKDLYSLKLYRTDASGNVTISIPAVADGGTAVLVESDTDKLFYVDAIEDQTYTGNAVTLDTDDLKVWYGTTLLEAGKDYKVSYKNNKTVGTATVTVTGIGNYEGKETASFNIVAKNLADSDVTITMQTDLIETGRALKPLTAVTYNGKKLGTKDYTVSYNAIGEEASKTPVKDVKTAGKYEMIITAVNKNFTGSVTKEFTVYAKADTLYMKDVNITLEYTTHEYTGAALKPTVTVTKKDKAKTPIATDAYSVTYDNNTDIGKAAKVTITGVPAKGLIGTVEKTFTITGTDISKVAEVDLTNWKTEVTYDVTARSAVQTNVTLKAKAGVDAEILADDYTVSYQKNDKPGTATMLFTGKGKYTGTIKKTFKVTKAALKEDDIFAGSTAVYLKKGSKVDVIVSLDEIILTEGKDYKLTFKNNKAVTTENMADNKKPSVTITGMGAFTGSVTKYFTIVPSDIDSLDVSVADVAYQNKKGKYISVPVVTEADGTKLANNKDFTCTYSLSDGTILTKNDVVDAGEQVKVTITAKGPNYTGETNNSYEVKVQDLSKAKVTVKAQVYTGEEIKLDASDFTIKVGDTTLKEGKHYYIDEDSYKNNIDKGTASVTIVGMGNYGGKKTVDFKITGRAVAWWWNLLH